MDSGEDLSGGGQWVLPGGGRWLLPRTRSFTFQAGPLHYRVEYYCGVDYGKKFTCIRLVLDSVSLEPRDPNLDYDRLDELGPRRAWPGAPYRGYGVTRTSAYVFKTLAGLAAILKDIIQKEDPDEIRCVFYDTRHNSFWKLFITYMSRPPWNLRHTEIKQSRFPGGGEEWVILLDK